MSIAQSHEIIRSNTIMAKELTPIDISSAHDLIRLAEEVRRSGKARLLRRGDEDLAVLSPIPAPPTPLAGVTKSLSPEEDAAFLSAAGSWTGLVDAEELKRTLRDERSDDRPPARL
jgi:hypothetical protein